MEIQDNIQWHPAFCSAVELELREYKKYLTYEREHNLGRMPLKIDLLIIKKRRDVIIKNDIADFFLGNNILEYKSPGDDVNAGTFYKALSYACLYKAEEGGNAVDPRFLLGHGVLFAELCQQLYRLLSGAFCPDYAPAHRSGISCIPAIPVPRRSRMQDAIVYCLVFPIKHASFPVCALRISYRLPVRSRIPSLPLHHARK